MLTITIIVITLYCYTFLFPFFLFFFSFFFIVNAEIQEDLSPDFQNPEPEEKSYVITLYLEKEGPVSRMQEFKKNKQKKEIKKEEKIANKRVMH